MCDLDIPAMVTTKERKGEKQNRYSSKITEQHNKQIESSGTPSYDKVLSKTEEIYNRNMVHPTLGVR